MTNKAPTIKSSAHARLLLYRLFSFKLTEVEKHLLKADPLLWEHILSTVEKAGTSEGQITSDEAVLKQVFSHIDRTTCDGLRRQVERLTGQSLWLGVHASELLDAFVDEHQKLLKSVQSEYVDKIGMAIKRGIREGRLARDIAKDIRNHTNLSKRRAQLIARNAPLHYSGALTKHHQTNAGITSYIWQSSRDERVRDSHRKYDGEIFSWGSSGPHPRSEVNCRCDAIPMVESKEAHKIR